MTDGSVRVRGSARVGRAVLGACLASVLAAGCVPRAAPASEPAAGAASQLEAAQSDLLAGFSARDADRVAGHFAEDAVLHVANMPPVRGRAAIRAFYGNVFRFMSASSPAVEETRVSAAGDLAYSTGRVVNVFQGPAGPTEYEGKFFLAWERRDGRWQVTVYGVSNDRAEAGR